MHTITRYTKEFAHYLRNNRAVSALEYAILVGAIAIAIAVVVGLNAFSTNIKQAMNNIGQQINSITSPSVPTINAS